MPDPNQSSALARIESRIDKTVSAQTGLTQTGAMNFKSVEQLMEFSKVMAIASVAVPKHLRENVGACLAVCIQASEWQMSPFAVASKTYVVNDRIAFEAQLVNAVILRRAPIAGRFKISYIGEGGARRCKVSVKLADGSEEVEYESPTLASIPVKNSQLWKGDPDQQLFYYSSRAMCRRHFPDVLIGIYTPDELEDSIPMDAKVIPVVQGNVGASRASALEDASKPRHESVQSSSGPASQTTKQDPSGGGKASGESGPEETFTGEGTPATAQADAQSDAGERQQQQEKSAPADGMPTLKENRADVQAKLRAMNIGPARFVTVLVELGKIPAKVPFDDLENDTLQGVIDEWDEFKNNLPPK